MTKNYKEIKNYIHNEEKITKEEIRDIIRQSINEEVQKVVYLKRELIDKTISNYIETAVRNAVTSNGNGYFANDFKTRVTGRLSDEMANFISKKIQLDIKIKEVE